MYILTEQELENKLREIAEQEARMSCNSLEEAEINSGSNEKTSFENDRYWQCFLLYLSNKDKVKRSVLETFFDYCKDAKYVFKIFLGYGEYLREQIEALKNEHKKLIDTLTDGHGFLCVCDNGSNFTYETAASDLIIIEPVTATEKQMLKNVMQEYNLVSSDDEEKEENSYRILEKLFSLAKSGKIDYAIPFKYFYAYVVKKTKSNYRCRAEKYYVNRNLFQKYVVSKSYLFDLKMRSDQKLISAGYYRILEKEYNLTTHYSFVLAWHDEAKYKIAAIKLPSRYVEVVD